jgi:hypothetical protein
MSEGWLDLENEQTGGTTRIPNDPAVLAAHEGRGWRVVEVPDPGPFVPDKVNVNPGDVAAAWVELVHPVTGARHQFPNNPDAVAGANEAGWVAPNRDGSIPKTAMRKAAREQGVDVDDLPASQADTGDDAPEEPPGGTAGEESDQPAGDSTATNEERVTRG